MPDILTHDRLQEVLKEKGLERPENASEGNLTQSSPILASFATPETITISLPALRAVVLTLIDDGWQCSKGCDLRHPWAFPAEMFNGDRHPSDEDIKLRERFCDLLAERLRQLPARG